MKTIIFIVITSASIIFSQTVYDITPGTKGNVITITVANISETNPATNVKVALVKESESITFNQSVKTIEQIGPAKEEKATFLFDVHRNTSVNKKDTIDFMITNPEGITEKKSFIFSYVAPKEFKLEQNFPNPFNPTTTIQYQLPENNKVTLKVYDILGSELKTLVNEEQEAGYKEVKFDASNVASGIYIYKLQAGKHVSIKKMMVIK